MVADKLMIMNEHTKGFVDIVQWLSNLVLSHLEIKGHKFWENQILRAYFEYFVLAKIDSECIAKSSCSHARGSSRSAAVLTGGGAQSRRVAASKARHQILYRASRDREGSPQPCGGFTPRPPLQKTPQSTRRQTANQCTLTATTTLVE
jgi:hypothetical protein